MITLCDQFSAAPTFIFTLTWWTAFGGSKRIITNKSIIAIIFFRLPSSGAIVPNIIKYMNMMIILATIVFVETIILKFITKSCSVQPLCIKCKFLSTNQILKYFVASPFDHIESGSINQATENYVEIEASQSSQPKKKNVWTIFCRFFDRVLFVVLCVCYKFCNGY